MRLLPVCFRKVLALTIVLVGFLATALFNPRPVSAWWCVGNDKWDTITTYTCGFSSTYCGNVCWPSWMFWWPGGFGCGPAGCIFYCGTYPPGFYWGGTDGPAFCCSIPTTTTGVIQYNFPECTPDPIITSFAVNGSSSTTVTIPATITLSWASTNTVTCYSSGALGSFPSLPTSGTSASFPTSTPGTYSQTLTCANMAGEIASASVTATVLSPPTADLLVNGQLSGPGGSITVTAPTSVTFSWTSTNTTTCSSSGALGSFPGLGTSGTSASFPTSTPGTYTQTLTCSNAGGNSASDSVTITVNLPPPSVVTLTFSPNQAGVLTPVTMSWSGNNSPTSYTLIRVDPPPLATVRSLSTMPLSLTEMPHEIGLIPGVYTFKVEACNDAGCGYTPDPGVTLTVTPASPVGPAWRVKDRLGNVLLTIDSQGNGIAPPPDRLPVFQFAIDNPPVPVPQGAVAGALVLKRRGTNVNVFVFSPAGLYFQGAVLEHQSQAMVSAIDGDDLVIRDSGRTPVARFDGATGNLYLRGHAVVGP